MSKPPLPEAAAACCASRIRGSSRPCGRLARYYTGEPYPRRDRRRISAWIAVDGWHGWGALKDSSRSGRGSGLTVHSDGLFETGSVAVLEFTRPAVTYTVYPSTVPARW
jgi:hypothetical protein